MHLLAPGDHVVAVNDVYGGIYRMFTQVYEPKGYRFTFLTPEEMSTGLADHLEERTKFVWLETPTNPALNIVDIAAASAAARRSAHSSWSTTLATPYLQQPLALGADVVLHSTTKYLGGHWTWSAGSSRRTTTRSPTGSPSCRSRSAPFPVRSTRGSSSAASRRSRAHGPPLRERRRGRGRPRAPPTSGARPLPRFAVAPRACDRRKADAELRGWSRWLLATEEEAVDVVARTKIWKLAESLGGVESMIEHPARMTHASTADGPFAVPPTLIRLSVGLESADDLIDDIEAALTG
jgi:cystathionine gamma-synthase